MAQAILAAHSYTTLAIIAIIDFFKDIAEDYRTARDVRSTMKELSKLSDRELNDIGIARGDIYSVARGDVEMRRSVKEVETNANMKGWV